VVVYICCKSVWCKKINSLLKKPPFRIRDSMSLLPCIITLVHTTSNITDCYAREMSTLSQGHFYPRRHCFVYSQSGAFLSQEALFFLLSVRGLSVPGGTVLSTLSQGPFYPRRHCFVYSQSGVFLSKEALLPTTP
jgi:hypothetical protein